MAQANCPGCGASLEQRGDQWVCPACHTSREPQPGGFTYHRVRCENCHNLSGLAGPRGGYVCGTCNFGVTPVGYELESAEARKRVSAERIARAKRERAAREKGTPQG
ncbi:hypothetical protein [Streptomyces sp. NPDC001985]|uniref:hypothetical protein n=1 Tax=Streptomyces sp. NPDC001985 TaxID=3154406 RepID=UPI00332A709A